MDSDDGSLVADFVARRPEGLARAYERFASLLVSVARHVLEDASAAEDCVHDALLRVWRAPEAYRPDRGSLRGFLVACVRNEAMSLRRSAARRLERERRVQRLDLPPPADLEVVDHVAAAHVRAALAKLPSEQRVALEQAYFANRTQSEIAAVLGVPLGTVKSRVSLGLRKLQAELTYGDSP